MKVVGCELSDSVLPWLKECAAEYCDAGETGDVSVTVKGHQTRSTVIMYDVEVTGPAWYLDVIVKMVRKDVDPGLSRKPILGEWCDSRTLLAYEYNSLKSIHDHVREIGDERFLAVRVLNYFESPAAFAMERLHLPNLRHLMLKERWSRTGAPPAAIRRAFRNTGAWLQSFHSLPRLEHTVPRRTHRGEFVESVQRFADYLAGSGVCEHFLSTLMRGVESTVKKTLSTALPCALGHGDFAPRNVLVGQDQCVAVIDTSARWWYPIYEDLGYMLASMRLIEPQLSLHGLVPSRSDWIRVFEEDFVEGYFGLESIPWSALRLYQIQALLATWASAVHDAKTKSGSGWLRHKLKRSIKATQCRQQVRLALEELDS